MEKEEILEKIKKENKDGDERQQQLDTKSYAIGFWTSNIFVVVYYLVYLFVGNENDKTHLYIMGPFTVANLAYWISHFYYFRKKTTLLWIALFGSGMIGFLYFLMTSSYIGHLWF